MPSPRPLSNIIKKVSDPIFGKKSMLYSQILENWTKIVGVEMAGYTQPIGLKFRRQKDKNNSSKLEICVPSARAQDIMMQKTLLLERLNQFMGFQAIYDLSLTHAPQSKIKKPKPKVLRKNPLSPSQKTELESKIHDVQDEGLKSALEKLGNAVYARTKTDL